MSRAGTYFFPVGDGIQEIVEEWVKFLREEKLWGNNDPLFPATHIAVGASQQFEAVGLERKHWNTAGPIRTIFRKAFENAGFPYFHPHSIRKTLTRFGQEVCQSAEEFKSWSQNFGHAQVLTTFMSYGTVATDRQGEIIRGLSHPRQSAQSSAEEIANAVFKKLQASGGGVPDRAEAS